ncbi:MAG: HAMP domain-containing protein [Ignavibacteriales bacterium]|nr:HAMP domain-containing protein [Melioribacteraceae bacterium]MCF8316640.1 HAMP domain-containing protein [Ignavibacteriales bacterium]MCF8438240.1 HAMP domain-containing protein [Ignavibacteriales bacterium]
MLNLKSKIYAGLAILILVIVIIASASIYNLKILSADSSAIIQDNYHTIDYSFLMLARLDNINNKLIKLSQNDSNYTFQNQNLRIDIKKHLESFNALLKLEENNITESGEAELVDILAKNFDHVKENIIKAVENDSGYMTPTIVNSISASRSTIHEIYKLNMQSIIHKNDIAEQTSLNTITYMLIISSFSLIIILFYVMRFPNYIVAPIRELTDKIRAVSSKRYDQKITIRSSDEIGVLTNSFNQMAERLKEYEEQHLDQLLLEKKRIDSLVYGLNDGVILLDEKQNIILINTTAERIISLGSAEIVNKNILLFCSQSKIMQLICSIVFSDKTKFNENFESLDFFDHKSKEYYNIDTIEIKDDNKNINGVRIKGLVIILRNVTPFKERDIAKTNMLATVSHELKTPISSINLSLKLLSNTRIGDLNSEQKKLIESISQQNKKLLRVVNEILDFSQAETGRINLIIETVDPRQVVDLATSALMMLISEKEINLKLDIMDNPPLIKADLEKSVWILVNILNNAIRYSSLQGKIVLSLKTDGGFVRFSVLDYGPGISEADQEIIFRKFIKDKTGYFKGTGLGLAIAKEFVESQGGKIWVDSLIANGSQFHFILPIAQHQNFHSETTLSK